MDQGWVTFSSRMTGLTILIKSISMATKVMEVKWWSHSDRLGLSCGPSFNKSLSLSMGMSILGTITLFSYLAFENLSLRHVSFRCFPSWSSLYCKIPLRGLYRTLTRYRDSYFLLIPLIGCFSNIFFSSLSGSSVQWKKNMGQTPSEWDGTYLAGTGTPVYLCAPPSQT